MANLTMLFERAEAELHGLKRRRTKTQEVLDLVGVQGVAWRYLSGTEVLQIYPPTKLRETFRDGDYLVAKNPTSECRYYDPNGNLKPDQWSYVGCNCSSLPDTQVWGWIKKAYENLKRDKGVRSKQQSRRGYSSSERPQVHDTTKANLVVSGIESLYRLTGTGGGFSEQPVWLDILANAVAELPRGCQGKRANELLAEALRRAQVYSRSEVAVSSGSAHAVDMVVECNGRRVGVELGTGQAERIELDLLKLINLALRHEVDFACLILPQNVTRPSVMGKQGMPTAVKNLARMCLPLLTLIQARLRDVFVIWYA